VADERTCPRSRDIERHDQDLREIKKDYFLKELALTMIGALTERVKDLEEELTSIRRGNRVAIIGGISAVATAVVLQFLKGGGH